MSSQELITLQNELDAFIDNFDSVEYEYERYVQDEFNNLQQLLDENTNGIIRPSKLEILDQEHEDFIFNYRPDDYLQVINHRHEQSISNRDYERIDQILSQFSRPFSHWRPWSTMSISYLRPRE